MQFILGKCKNYLLNLDSSEAVVCLGKLLSFVDEKEKDKDIFELLCQHF